MMEMIQIWLGFVLDMLVACLAIFFIGLAVGLRGSTTAGPVGIALNVLLSMSTTLVRLLEMWTQMETSLGAVARVKNIEKTLKSEDKEGEDFEPPEKWPERGAIEFREVTASYKSVYGSPSGPTPFLKDLAMLTLHSPETIALKGVSLNISAGQKVGICGRTGRYLPLPLPELTVACCTKSSSA